jgi:hypothetical protein
MPIALLIGLLCQLYRRTLLYAKLRGDLGERAPPAGHFLALSTASVPDFYRNVRHHPEFAVLTKRSSLPTCDTYPARQMGSPLCTRRTTQSGGSNFAAERTVKTTHFKLAVVLLEMAAAARKAARRERRDLHRHMTSIAPKLLPASFAKAQIRR